MSSETTNIAKAPPSFAVGPAAQREVKRALRRSTNPAETISNFQKTRSLHSMLSKAFGTIPQWEYKEKHEGKDEDENLEVEPLDTDPVLTFLTHLGVSQTEVYKRIADSLQKQLEEEIRKIHLQSSSNKNTKPQEQALLHLLKSCWHHATTVPLLRPILWACLKQLGPHTPLAVLKALAERDAATGNLKHAEIFRPLPPLLKRLVWEADWDDKVATIEVEGQTPTPPKEYLQVIQSTLLYETVQPLVEQYCATPKLVEAAGKLFVHSTLERRILTTQRRALASASKTSNTTGGNTGPAGNPSSTTALLGKSAGLNNKESGPNVTVGSDSKASSGKAVSNLRNLLGDASGSGGTYRPKLLHAALSMLLAHHGAQAPRQLLAGHLHCTLVSDLLLSAGGPLPKHYSHLHTLARVLDDAVKQGIMSDVGLSKVQASLTEIYTQDLSEGEEGKGTEKDKDKPKKKKGGDSDTEGDSDKKSKKNKNQPTTFLQRQLNRIITAGLSAMKESDPQSLFLNPVTDGIAPGYSKIIKKPMSISTMESKIDNNVYNSIDDWNTDVKLMFKNCVDYNRGQAGQWFRGEAQRQLKVFRDEILPQAKKLYQVELKRRDPEEALIARRLREEQAKEQVKKTSTLQVKPLSAARKKRKLTESSSATQEYTLSMPALASMLLADPFVVRLLLDRVIRSIRIDVLRGTTVPVAHSVVPSILQLLHIAQWSTQICALRGRRYLIPDPGLKSPERVEAVEALVPFNSLRRYLPVLTQVVQEADLDKRLAVGGDLHSVVDTLTRPPPPIINLQSGSPPLQVAIALIEGVFVFLCTPGSSQEASLSLTFEKCSTTLLGIVGGSSRLLWEETPFFKCLVPAILRHKARLNRTVRDTIISVWTNWLKAPSQDGNSTKKKSKKTGSMTSAAHEYLILLFNEWASFGNLLMPRDLLLKVSTELVKTVDETENTPRKFVELWNNENDKDFTPIKTQYERLLSLLPATHSTQWKQALGIDRLTEDEKDEDGDVEMNKSEEVEEMKN